MTDTARVRIFGGPRTGKTTMALRMGRESRTPVRHTDSLIASHGWSEASAAVADWLNEPGPWIVEGVAVGRALRKWLAAHPTGKPCDVLIWLNEPMVALTRGQDMMAQGCRTIMREIYLDLVARDVVARDVSIR